MRKGKAKLAAAVLWLQLLVGDEVGKENVQLKFNINALFISNLIIYRCINELL
jgi:hypothetical protein